MAGEEGRGMKREKLIHHLPPVRIEERQWLGLGRVAADTDMPISDHVRAAIDHYLSIVEHVRTMGQRRDGDKPE